MRNVWRTSVQPWLQHWESAVLFACIGTVIGFCIGVTPNLRSSLKGTLSLGKWVLICSLAGALIGIVLVLIYRWVTGRGWNLSIEEIEAPLIGGKIKVKVTGENRAIGWKIFVEAATRITTQPLGEKEGLLREALASMHKFFSLVRDELKNANPSPPPTIPGSSQYTLESHAVLMLNDALRPTLARWHPRLLVWEQAGMPESLWPLSGACRRDIEIARKRLLAYTWGLGELYKIKGLKELLGEEPAKPLPKINEQEDAADLAILASLDAILSGPQRQQAWHILIEASTRISSQPLGNDDGVLREALSSLYKLFDIIRTELKSATHAPAFPNPALPANPTFVSCAIHILNDALRPMLAYWHPRLLEWEKTGLPESLWPLANMFRHDLEVTRKRVLIHLWEICERLKVPEWEHLLNAKPAAPGKLTPHEEIATVERERRAQPSVAARSAGWHIFVELVSRVAVQPLQDKTGDLGEALSSLHDLYGIIRAELKGILPPHSSAALEGDTVESIALEILNGPLRQFLAKWHPKLLALEEQNKGNTQRREHEKLSDESEREFRRELEEVRADVTAKARRLANVIGIRGTDKFLLPRGGDTPQR